MGTYQELEGSFANDGIKKLIAPNLRGQSNFQSFAGTDITVVAYIPYVDSVISSSRQYKKFAEIQTISISSTRSMSPIRVLGKSSPAGYTRGARTFAGTMVFASLNHDVFQEMYTVGIQESAFYHSTSQISDQLPPFTIVITAANEKGAAAVQAIYGITLVNYGTTYSIDDLYTEVTYTYVAQDVSPFTNMSLSAAGQGPWRDNNKDFTTALKSLSDLADKRAGTNFVNSTLGSPQYPQGRVEDYLAKIKKEYQGQKAIWDPVVPVAGEAAIPDLGTSSTENDSFPRPGESRQQWQERIGERERVREELGFAFLKSNQIPVNNFGRRIGIINTSNPSNQ
jgi:hypothetical protein